MNLLMNSNLPPDITSSTSKKHENEIKFCDGYQYDAVCPHDLLHFSSVKDWKAHHIQKHMATKWKCPLCGVISASWHNYSYHVQIQEHNGVCPPPWICKLKLPSNPNQNKKAHSTINTTKTKSKSNRFVQLCEKRFGSKYQLLRHMKSEHGDYKVIDSKSQRAAPKRTINRCMNAMPMLPALPAKKRKINTAQYKTQGTQCGFLNTLFAAATFIEKNEKQSECGKATNVQSNNVDNGVLQMQQIQNQHIATRRRTNGRNCNLMNGYLLNGRRRNLVVNYNNNVVINNNLINFNHFYNNNNNVRRNNNFNNMQLVNACHAQLVTTGLPQNGRQQLIRTGLPQNVTLVPMKRAPRIVFVLKDQHDINRK